MGANRGDNIIKFYNSGSNILKGLKIPSNPDEYCYHAFEPNYHWRQSLNNLKKKHYNLTVYNLAVVGNEKEKEVDFYLDGLKYYQGSTIVKSKKLFDKKGYKQRVYTINSVKWFDKYIKKESINLLKIDVEGSEYDILSSLILSGNICKVHTLFIEWHGHKTKLLLPQNIENVFYWLFKKCNINIFSITPNGNDEYTKI